MYGFQIDQPIDPNLITREEAAVILHRSVQGMANQLDAGRLTKYQIRERCILVDRREDEALAPELHSKH